MTSISKITAAGTAVPANKDVRAKIAAAYTAMPASGNAGEPRVHAGPPMFRMLRYFSVASLLCILAAAVLLVMVYRNTAVESLQQFGKERNTALAQTALIPMRDDLVKYLTRAADLRPGQAAVNTLPDEVHNIIRGLMARDGTVARVKVYNALGTVVFSTKSEQIGAAQEDNDGFRTAMAGGVATEFIYRDALNPFDRATEEDNLIQTYVPVRAGAAGPAVGVFEIYTDMSPLVRQVERLELAITVASLVVLLVLYGVLVPIVRRAKRIIDTQQQTIRERTSVLERLSSQMLKNEEQEKQRLARELHEGIAQTLSAVKLHVENACRLAGILSPQSATHLQAIVPSLQSAIRDVRGISMALRPSSLDDLGILATLAWLCREFEAIYPHIQIHQQFEVQESQVPAALKVIVYRIAETALKRVARRAASAMVRIRLVKGSEGIELLIDDQAVEPSDDSAGEDQGSEADLALLFLTERATLSGGSLTYHPNQWGGTTLHSRWSV